MMEKSGYGSGSGPALRQIIGPDPHGDQYGPEALAKKLSFVYFYFKIRNFVFFHLCFKYTLDQKERKRRNNS